MREFLRLYNIIRHDHPSYSKGGGRDKYFWKSYQVRYDSNTITRMNKIQHLCIGKCVSLPKHIRTVK